MRFYFTDDFNPEELEREAFRDLYIKKIKKVNELRKKNKKLSGTHSKALETLAGTKSNANHKSDMAIMKNNNQIKRFQNQINYIDSIYKFNLFEDNLILYNMYKKIIEEYKGAI